MTVSEIILDMAKKNQGVITSKQVTDEGLSRGVLKYLEEIGSLDKVSRGVYTLPTAWENEFVNLQSQYKKGIYSLATSLYLHELTDKTPGSYDMTFPDNYNLSGPKKAGINAHRSKEPYYSLGIVVVNTPTGQKVKCYNPEKTLCDILRTHYKVDLDIITEAFKMYSKRKNKDINLLSDYSKVLHVEDKVRSYLEVLL